jgi:hypothetical protein
VLGELADRRGLAGAVDARHHDHGGLVLADHQRLLQRPQQLRERVDQDVLGLHRPGGAAGGDLALALRQQELGGGDAGVGQQQRRLQFLVQASSICAPVKTCEMLEPVLRRPG